MRYGMEAQNNSKGNMLEFIKNFLRNRIFLVKTSNTLFETFNQENGVPQGSSRSVTLFLISINDIFEGISHPNIPLLYADDFTIICQSTNSNTIQQINLSSGQKHPDFAPEKTNRILFNQKKKEKISQSTLAIITSKTIIK